MCSARPTARRSSYAPQSHISLQAQTGTPSFIVSGYGTGYDARHTPMSPDQRNLADRPTALGGHSSGPL